MPRHFASELNFYTTSVSHSSRFYRILSEISQKYLNVWPRGLMVKALVFGTKDLCVRIAPWSLFMQPSFFANFESQKVRKTIIATGGCWQAENERTGEECILVKQPSTNVVTRKQSTREI